LFGEVWVPALRRTAEEALHRVRDTINPRKPHGRFAHTDLTFQTAKTQSDFEVVITGLDPVIHLLRTVCYEDRWMPGSPVYAKASPGLPYWSAEAVAKAEVRA
jgi:hypothetical protein